MNGGPFCSIATNHWQWFEKGAEGLTGGWSIAYVSEAVVASPLRDIGDVKISKDCFPERDLQLWPVMVHCPGSKLVPWNPTFRTQSRRGLFSLYLATGFCHTHPLSPLYPSSRRHILGGSLSLMTCKGKASSSGTWFLTFPQTCYQGNI